jgi:hypothetical protein
MQRLHYITAGALALVISGFIIVSFIQSRSQLMANKYNTMQVVVPTALAGFPDIERVPVYPNPNVTFIINEPQEPKYISYEAGDSIQQVKEFYHEMLPREGWLLRSSDGPSSKYSWTNPADKPFWHMYLKVTIQLTLDDSRTLVYLEYDRYPNVVGGLPQYPEAQQATATSSNVERSFPGVPGFPDRKKPVFRTDITYLSNASPRDIADFYTNSMYDSGWSIRDAGWSKDENAWFYYDRLDSGGGDKPTGDVISQEGLYFLASRPTWDKPNLVFYHLLITANVQEDGRTLVNLRVEEFEPSGPGI